MRYSIDTSALLDGWRRYYPPEVFPRLWRRIEDLIATGDSRASEEVPEELKKRDDDAFLAWARSQEDFFVPLDDPVQDAVSDILRHHPKLIDTRKGRSAADPFVIALARVVSCAVVTGEGATGSLSRPNIPDVCDAMGIRCLRLLDLFRAERWSF